VSLPANTTYISLQNNTSIGIPAGVIAALRLRQPFPVRKTTLKGLDDINPGWQNVAAARSLQAWFPLGVSQFGIYPQLSSPVQALMDFIVSPVNMARPYTTNIPVQFLTEFCDLLPMGAAVTLRSKELGAESEEASQVMADFMGQLRALSLYQNRLDAQVWTAAYGAKAGVQKREIV
jgi:hypothetical protein